MGLAEIRRLHSNEVIVLTDIDLEFLSVGRTVVFPAFRCCGTGDLRCDKVRSVVPPAHHDRFAQLLAGHFHGFISGRYNSA